MSAHGKDCEDFWNLLSARLDGELGEDERHALDAHLASCAACRSVDEGFRLDDAALRRAAEPGRRAAARLGERVAASLGGRNRRRPARLIVLALAAAAAGFAAACLIFQPWQPPGEAPGAIVRPIEPPAPAPAFPAARQVAARLSLATGRVEMLLPGGADWSAVPTGGEIEPGTRLRTGSGVLCELAGGDGSSVRLDEGSEVALTGARSFDLARGRLWSHVERDPAPFQVQAAGAAITALGTKFDVRLEGAGAELIVIEGVTRVAGAGGAPELVRAGERATIEAGSVRARGLSYDVVLATSWINRLLALKEDSDPELTAKLGDLLAQVGRAKLEMLAEREILALGESCVRPLLSYLQSERARVDEAARHKAAEVLEKLAPRWAVKDLIDLLAHQSPTVRAAAARALGRLTGESQGQEPEAWRGEPWSQHEAAYGRWLDWWKLNAPRYAPAKR